MQIGMVGLGRMGANIVRRLHRHGHESVVYDRSQQAVNELAGEGATPSDGLKELVGKLAKPRTGWIMLPGGAPTEDTVRELATLLEAADTIIDGRNSFY